MEDIKKKISEWTNPPYDNNTINEIKSLVDKDDQKELKDRFYTHLEFGTGGLRGVIGAGTNRMNIYTVGMATQGLANYILSMNGKDKGIVIARDSRNMSDRFAQEAASIMACNGIKVYFFNDITPTPICSYAIRILKAVSGIVITASHNPPEYNGYKVYWDDGGQIVAPHDKNIINEVTTITDIKKIKKIDFNEGVKSKLITYIDEEIITSYIASLEKSALRPIKDSHIKIVYTPLHGTGYKIVPKILDHFGFKKVVPVEKQSIPDSKFPTVKYPNPEEKEALTLALDLAKKENADIIMATDPDADRMGIGFKDKNNEYLLINGNQIGSMLEYYLLSRSKENNKLPANASIIKTVVTSELQREIAEAFNCHIDDVLTGFKWIASKMKQYDDSGKFTFIFGGEESYGYLPVNFVRDKDAISACYFFAEMTDWLQEKNMTLYDFLDEIYIKHSLYLEDLHSLTLKGIEGNEQIKMLMDNFRKKPPVDFAGISVEKIADLSVPMNKYLSTGKEESIKDLPTSNVLQFFLKDGSKITMRPSGTEPKIKFYFSVRDKVTKENIEQGKKKIRGKLEELKKDFLNKVDSAGK